MAEETDEKAVCRRRRICYGFFMMLGGLLLLPSGGPASPALARETRIEMRPGLTVWAGDGHLSRAAMKRRRSK